MFMGLFSLEGELQLQSIFLSVVYPQDFLTYFFFTFVLYEFLIGKEVGLLCVIGIKLWLIAFPGEIVLIVV